jgi:lysophospholipase L1-like esterase
MHSIARFYALFMIAASCLLQASPAKAGEPLIANGESLAFFGDSITAAGWGNPLGYVRLVVAGLDANGIQVKPVPAGVSGHKSNDMLARLQRDVIDKKPTWMTLSCGVNDVWHGKNGVPLPQYQTNITAIVEKAQAAGIKVMILTSTLIGEDVTNQNNQIAIPYNDFLRSLAAEKKCVLVDLNADMRAALANMDPAVRKRGNQLTVDGVHMNTAGDMIMATGILRAFGLSDAQLACAREVWLAVPNAMQVGAQPRVSLKEFQQLKAAADKQKRSINEIVNDAISGAISNLLQSAK